MRVFFLGSDSCLSGNNTRRNQCVTSFPYSYLPPDTISSPYTPRSELIGQFILCLFGVQPPSITRRYFGLAAAMSILPVGLLIIRVAARLHGVPPVRKHHTCRKSTMYRLHYLSYRKSQSLLLPSRYSHWRLYSVEDMPVALASWYSPPFFALLVEANVVNK